MHLNTIICSHKHGAVQNLILPSQIKLQADEGNVLRKVLIFPFSHCLGPGPMPSPCLHRSLTGLSFLVPGMYISDRITQSSQHSLEGWYLFFALFFKSS